MDNRVRMTTASEVYQKKELGILKHLCKIVEKNQYFAPFSWRDANTKNDCQYWGPHGEYTYQ